MQEVIKEHRISRAGRDPPGSKLEGKIFGKRIVFMVTVPLCVCACLSPRESWEGFFCSEDILPDPGKGSQSSSVLIAFSLIMAYPVSLLPRAPWSCSEALKNTFQPGRYCVNANYCIAALKMLFRSWGGIFRQFIGAVAECLFRELQSKLKELGFWLILPRKEI